MSKSLKNFITIQELLKNYNWQTIRMYFLLQAYHARMNFTTEGLEYATIKEKQLRNTIILLQSKTRDIDHLNNVKLNKNELEIASKINNTYDKINDELSDNFKTSQALNI